MCVTLLKTCNPVKIVLVLYGPLGHPDSGTGCPTYLLAIMFDGCRFPFTAKPGLR
jgi:hypothetical protein